jgi:hypothetical protein
MINRIKVPFALCAGLFIIACVVRARANLIVAAANTADDALANS